MHEMALTASVVRIIEREAAEKDFTKVRTVWLEIGRLSCAEPEALHFCFDAQTRDTLVEGARLEIVRTPGAAWCMACAKTVAINRRFDPCPECAGHQLQVTGGEEMRIKELEVE